MKKLVLPNHDENYDFIKNIFPYMDRFSASSSNSAKFEIFIIRKIINKEFHTAEGCYDILKKELEEIRNIFYNCYIDIELDIVKLEILIIYLSKDGNNLYILNRTKLNDFFKNDIINNIYKIRRK